MSCPTAAPEIPDSELLRKLDPAFRCSPLLLRREARLKDGLEEDCCQSDNDGGKWQHLHVPWFHWAMFSRSHEDYLRVIREVWD